MNTSLPVIITSLFFTGTLFSIFFLVARGVFKFFWSLIRRKQLPAPPPLKSNWKKVRVFIFLLLAASGSLGLLVYLTSVKISITKDAFFVQAPVLKEAAVKYTNKAGKSFTVPTFEGVVEVLVEPGKSVNKVREIMSANDGEIIGQVPEAGYYVVKVAVGQEAGFIRELYQEPIVRTVFPYQLLHPNTSIQVDEWEQKGLFGLGVVTSADGAAHGDLVRYFIKGKKFDAQEKDACRRRNECVEAAGMTIDTLGQIGEAIEAHHNDANIIINLSYGPQETDEQGKPLPADVIQSERADFFSKYMNLLERQDLGGIEQTVIVNSAGNAGEDLTAVFAGLKQLPNHDVLDRLIIVGALDKNGNLAAYSNYSTNPEDMIYVPVKEGAQGTSYAAPQITYLIDQVLSVYPELAKDPQELKALLFHPAVAKLKSNRYVIEDPYDPVTIKNALTIAKWLSGHVVSASGGSIEGTLPLAASDAALTFCQNSEALKGCQKNSGWSREIRFTLKSPATKAVSTFTNTQRSGCSQKDPIQVDSEQYENSNQVINGQSYELTCSALCTHWECGKRPPSTPSSNPPPVAPLVIPQASPTTPEPKIETQLTVDSKSCVVRYTYPNGVHDYGWEVVGTARGPVGVRVEGTIDGASTPRCGSWGPLPPAGCKRRPDDPETTQWTMLFHDAPNFPDNTVYLNVPEEFLKSVTFDTPSCQ